MPERLPDFLGLGTQKGGTTTLHQLLTHHPGVHLPACKEVHYFSKHWHHSKRWYSDHFNESRPDQCCGEITPFYLFHPEVPQRIHSLLPTVKLLVLLRDPVERALSQVFHARKRGFETLDPAEAIAAEPGRLADGDPESLQKHSYLSRSNYLEQMDRYESLFPPKQLLVLQSEALFSDPEPTWNHLQAFLGLESVPVPEEMPRANAGEGDTQRVDPILRNHLRRLLGKTAMGVRERYGFGWDWAS
ncbi:MAG: sulfotransferase [Flavobacteriales bacterium]|nr:sulfotransferase [Flavobacteriales bacterium]